MAGKLPDPEQELFARIRMLEHVCATLLGMQLAKAPDLIGARFKEELILTRPRMTSEEHGAVSERIEQLLRKFLESVSKFEGQYRDSAVSLHLGEAQNKEQ